MANDKKWKRHGRRQNKRRPHEDQTGSGRAAKRMAKAFARKSGRHGWGNPLRSRHHNPKAKGQ